MPEFAGSGNPVPFPYRTAPAIPVAIPSPRVHLANGAAPWVPPSPRIGRYRGKISLLPNTCSASDSFIRADRRQPQCDKSGPPLFLRLSRSGIEIDLPVLWQATTDPRRQGGVSVGETAGGIAGSRDGYLRRCLGLLRKGLRCETYKVKGSL